MGLVQTASARGNGGAPAITAATDFAGCSLLVAVVSNITSQGAISDGVNTWLTGGERDTGLGRLGRLYYVIDPIVSSPLTITAGDSFPSVSVAGFSYASQSLDDDTAGNSSGTPTATVSCGALTPAQATNLMIGALFGDGYGTPPTIDSGYAIAAYQQKVGGESECSALAYLEQASATLQNPTFTVSSQDFVIGAFQVSFSVTAGGGGPRRFLLTRH